MKTLRDDQNPEAVRRFRDECNKLTKLPAHPNLIEIRDVIEIPIRGIVKPFLVMSLIQGNSLAELLQKGRPPVGRGVDMIVQICRGLQAAHDAGVIHRDLKPANIVVVDDNAIKIIDFGLAHWADVPLQSTLGAGTPLYRCPEQVLRRQVTTSSDIFSVGVIAYEMLAGSRPFHGNSEKELDERICEAYPPGLDTLNPSANGAIARVVHKAMAKSPVHRFGMVREFGEALDGACRGQLLELLNPVRIRPRLRRAIEAIERDDLDNAREIVDDLADEHLDEELWRLKTQLEQKIRDKRVKHLVEIARARMEEGEYSMALRYVQDARDLDPDLDRNNRDVGLLYREILATQAEADIDSWRKLAEEHAAKHFFDLAREALRHVLEKRPNDEDAQRGLSAIRRQESEYLRTLKEKKQLYDGAVNDFDRGHVATAAEKMKRVLELDRQAPDRGDPQEASRYQIFFGEVSSRREALDSAEAKIRKLESEGALADALRLCNDLLLRFPAGHAVLE